MRRRVGCLIKPRKEWVVYNVVPQDTWDPDMYIETSHHVSTMASSI